MEGQIYKTLIEQQHIFDHLPIDFSPLIAVKVVPAHSPQAALKRRLHSAQFLRADDGRQNNYPVGFQLSRQATGIGKVSLARKVGMKIDFAQVLHQLVPGIISLISGGPSSLSALRKKNSRPIIA